MFLEMSPMEIILILAIALMVFGPAKLPELGKSLGSAIREFKKESANLTQDIAKAINEEPTPPAAPAPKPDGGNPQAH